MNYRFGDWTVEPARNRVCGAGREVSLEPLSMDMLRHLLERPGRTVSADELLDAVWGRKVVEANAIHQRIGQIRRALGDDPARPRYIETIRKRGYRTLAAVERLESDAGTAEPVSSGRLHSVRWRLLAAVAGTVVGTLLVVTYRNTLMLALILNVPALFFGEPIEQHLGFTAAADGTRIAYATSGAGPPIVYVLTIGTHLENGQSSPFYDNDRLLAMSSRDHLFVRYDGRGSGLSDRDLEDYSLEARVSDLAAVVDALALERFGLLAVSAGGPPAIVYAVRHPERVSRLVLAGTVASYDWMSEPDRQRFEQSFDLYEVAWQRPEVSNMWADLLLAPGGDALDRRFLGEMLRRAGRGPDVAAFMRASMNLDVREEARRLQVPTLVVHARDDQAVPFAAGREMAALIPGAKLEVVKGGHMASSASRADVRRRVLAFLESGR